MPLTWTADQAFPATGNPPQAKQNTWANEMAAVYGLFGEATYDSPSMADGAVETTTVTVAGAAVGDLAIGAAFSALRQGIRIVDVEFTDTDEATVTLENKSGGLLNLDSGTLRVWGRKVP